MMKFNLFLLIILSLGMTACVSTGKHNILEAEAGRYQQEVKLLAKKNVELTDLLKQAQLKIDTLLDEKSNLELEIQSYKSRIEEMQNANAKLQDVMNARESDKDQIIAGLTSCKTDYEDQLAQKELEIQKQQNEINKLQKQIDDVLREKEESIKNMETTYDNLMSDLKNEIQNGQIQITQLQDKLSVNIVEKILFDTGKAEIKPEGKNVLSRVAMILKELQGQQIRIEGHTDNVPIGKELQKTYPSNWELSTARATNVVRFLVETHDLDPRAISATGYSEFHPVETNTTSEGKAKNRRIEIVVVPVDVDRVVKHKIYE
ncbi:MAG: OmpA family protein [Candidatus Marinimicrobia bacterium]|nr:OmpA family protein [Candidatus Neomarinimicrobiota bacterium]